MSTNDFYTEENTPFEIFAGDHPVITNTITIASGTGKLSKGTILGRITETGKYKAYSSTATDGSEVPRGILKGDVDATLKDVNMSIYRHGVFNKDVLIGLDQAAEWKLEEFGIFFGKVY